MPSEYMPRNDAYWMRHELYMMTKYLILDYPCIKQEYQNILHSSPQPPDGMPRGNGLNDPTLQKVEKLEILWIQIKAIDSTIFEMQNKYADTYTGEAFDAYGAFIDEGIFAYYRSKKGGECAPHRETWRRYRHEFAHGVAKRMGWI